MHISIVMPCFNVANTVANTLASVWDQTHADYELLAIDDGSSDGTIQAIKDSSKQHMPATAQLRVFSQENRGAGAARNLGMREARGSLVAFLDADDFWKPEYLATAIAAYRSHPQIEALASNSFDMGPDGNTLNIKTQSDSPIVIDDLFAALLDGTVLVRTSGVTIRRTVVDRVGYMREDLRRGQDYEYWSRLAASHVCWGFSPKPLVLYDAVRLESLSRNALRFKNAASPETWSKDVWPLLDADMSNSFQRWYLRYAMSLCWEQLQVRLDAEAKATAKEAFRRTTGCRATLFLLAVRLVPGWIHRLLWRSGSKTKRLVRSVKRTLRDAASTSALHGTGQE